MTELERYISSNAGAFDSEPVPAGSRERFMASVAAERRKRRIWYMAMAINGIAAALAALIRIGYQPDMENILEKHYTRIAETELAIISIAGTDHPDEIEEVMSSIHSITFESIPMEEQLPDEIPLKERIRILNDYYNMKHEALKSLMAEL